MGSPAVAGVVAFAATLVLTPLFRRGARRFGFLDRPAERSSHTGVVPRAGGTAVVVAVGLALALAPSLWWGRPAAAALLAGALVLAAVGLCDDRVGLSPAVRLVCQVAVAVGFVSVAGALDRVPLPHPLDVTLGPAGPAFSVLWIVAVINFYNFMDGIDGLASLQAVVTGAGIAVAAFDPFASFLGAALAGGAAAFLLFNWSPASIFLGDGGSSVLGFAFAALPFVATPGSTPAAVTFVALSLWLFLADATWTLFRRVARGERRLHQAHREHLYQRLVSAGWSHPRVSLGLGAASAVLTLAALLALRSPRGAAWWASILLALAAVSAEILLVRGRERGARRPAETGEGP
jgi:UDP-N-acetylmuramyl pentapeptide phosphotransferase/UDP-N-acetylglucosamine-1-phosphate transferase